MTDPAAKARELMGVSLASLTPLWGFRTGPTTRMRARRSGRRRWWC